MTGAPAFPRFRPVADHGVLAEFAETATPGAQAAVLRLDHALAADPFPGFAEAVPALTSLLVVFDPLRTDHDRVTVALRALLDGPAPPAVAAALHNLPVCYDDALAPDLPEVARRTGLAPEAVIAAHLAAEYAVGMYGFAPGYAYLGGLPQALNLPRKPAALRDVPAGSVLIAGAQCLVSTLTMPTGWWIIGRSPARILRDDTDRPFLFGVGDRVRFHRIGRAAFDAAQGS